MLYFSTLTLLRSHESWFIGLLKLITLAHTKWMEIWNINLSGSTSQAFSSTLKLAWQAKLNSLLSLSSSSSDLITRNDYSSSKLPWDHRIFWKQQQNLSWMAKNENFKKNCAQKLLLRTATFLWGFPSCSCTRIFCKSMSLLLFSALKNRVFSVFDDFEPNLSR